ncbi:zinc finger, CCHC-type containing protein [Tanacetum coccineum]
MASKNLMQMSTDIVKLDRFDGGSFKRWQKKMQFLLATLNVAYVLTKPYPEESENETLAASRERLKFENDDFICRRHILNAMSDPLFDVYQNYSTAKELWNALEERYFTENTSNVKKNLKHRKDDLSLKDLGKHLLIEEQYRLENKTNDDTSKVHVVEEKGVSSKASGKKATQYVYNDQTMFKTYEPLYSMLYMGNHSTAQVKGKGKIDLVFTSGNTLTLNDVLHVLDVHKNLVSRSLLNKFGFKLVFKSDKFILSKGGKFVGKGYHTGGMFKLNIKDVGNSSVNDVNMTDISDTNDVSAGIITRLPFPTSQRSSKILELVHSDVCDLHATPTIGGKKIYKSEVELKCDTRIKCLRTDRGGEYYDPRYFQSTGIVHQVTAPYTPQQNGIAKRKNRTLMDMVNSMMLYSGLSYGYWGEALLTAFEGDRKGLIREYPIIYNLDEEPQTYSEAMKSHDSSFWKEAVNDEMDSIIGNNTLILVDLPPGSKDIKSKWIFKRKLRVDGSIEKFKARLVAKGFTQIEGLDYFDTYAPVARTTTIRILIALASINKLIIRTDSSRSKF